MNSKILEKAQHIIDLRRYDAENQAINNKIKALEDAEFKRLYLFYTTLMIENAKNQDKNTERLNQLKTLLHEKEKSLNLSITPLYSCNLCNDRGRVNGELCICLKNEINKILIQESGFGRLEKFEEARFDIFENPELMKKLYEKMNAWCDSDFKKNIIYIGGDTGVGKTHLMCCIANKLISKGKLVSLTTSFNINQDFAKCYAMKDNLQENDILNRYLNADVLFIDDLGTELRKPFTSNYLYLVLNERKMNKRPTIITSNLTLEDIREYYDERVFSRIVDKDLSICIYLTGKDLRLQNK